MCNNHFTEWVWHIGTGVHAKNMKMALNEPVQELLLKEKEIIKKP